MILRRIAETGERAKQGGDRSKSHGATLQDLGIPNDRASRAMQLAEVPQDQFDAERADRPSLSDPRRTVRARWGWRSFSIVPRDSLSSFLMMR